MENKESVYNENYDEISLMEIISIIIKRKWIIVACLLFTIIATFFYILTKKPIYESKAVVQIGYNGEKTSTKVLNIEDPASLAWVLKNTEGLFSVNVEKADRSNLDILSLTIRNRDPYQAQASLEKVTNNLINRHSLLYNQLLSYKQNQLDSLKKQLQSVQVQLKLFEKKISLLINDNTNNMLLILEKEKLVKNQFELEQKISEQEFLLSENYIRPTRVLKGPTLALKPIGRNKLFYIGLASVLGVMIGVMLALFVEYFQKHFSADSLKDMSASE